MNYSLGKETKLKGKKTIDELFKNGKSIRKGTLRFIYMPSKVGSTHKIGFVVPKRYVKKAVDRNRIKRLLREAYRLHQNELMLSDDLLMNGMFVYQSSRMPELKSISRLVQSQIKILNKKAFPFT